LHVTSLDREGRVAKWQETFSYGERYITKPKSGFLGSHESMTKAISLQWSSPFHPDRRLHSTQPHYHKHKENDFADISFHMPFIMDYSSPSNQHTSIHHNTPLHQVFHFITFILHSFRHHSFCTKIHKLTDRAHLSSFIDHLQQALFITHN